MRILPLYRSTQNSRKEGVRDLSILGLPASTGWAKDTLDVATSAPAHTRILYRS